jgi:C_GCAxxG_C_C family probable redox protein
MTTPTEKAAAIFSQKFNCCQAVFSAFAPQFGLDEETALKLASPFGGGVARQGEVCGAVTGALLAIGLARSAGNPASNPETYRLSQEFLRKFEETHGTILCRNLIDFDISNPAGYQTAADAGVFVTICPGLVRDAVEIVQAVLEIA